MASDGNIPFRLSPFTYDIDFESLNAQVESTTSKEYPLKVNPSWPKFDILESIVNHHRSLIANVSLDDLLGIGRFKY